MSVKSAAAIVASAAAAVLVLSPASAQARTVLPSDTGVVETPSTVISLPPGGVIDCTADHAYRYARPCIRKGIVAWSPQLG